MANNVISLLSLKKPFNKAATQDDELGSKAVKHATAGQLAFEFSATHEIFIADTSTFNRPGLFLDFLECSGPQHILDMRVAPRMGFIDESRQRAFDVLKGAGINYTDMLGRAGVHTYHDRSERLQVLWFKLVRLFEELPIDGRPILTLFDDAEFAERFKSIFAHISNLHNVDARYVDTLIDRFTKIRM